MSWEYSKFEAQCDNCRKQGFCIKGSDDWNRTSTTWEGFDNVSADATEVARKKADRRDARPICSCGSSRISVGKYVGDI